MVTLPAYRVGPIYYAPKEVYEELKIRGFELPESTAQFVIFKPFSEWKNLEGKGEFVNLGLKTITGVSASKVYQEVKKSAPKDAIITDIRVTEDKIEYAYVSKEAIKQEVETAKQIAKIENYLRQHDIPYKKIETNGNIKFEITAPQEKLLPHLENLKNLGFVVSTIASQQKTIQNNIELPKLQGTYTYEGLKKEIENLNVTGRVNVELEPSRRGLADAVLDFMGIKGIAQALTGVETGHYKVNIKPEVFGIEGGTRTASVVKPEDLKVNLGEIYLTRELDIGERVVKGVAGIASLAFVVSVAKSINNIVKASIQSIKSETITATISSNIPKAKFEKVAIGIEKIYPKQIASNTEIVAGTYTSGESMLKYTYIKEPFKETIKVFGEKVYLPAEKIKLPSKDILDISMTKTTLPVSELVKKDIGAIRALKIEHMSNLVKGDYAGISTAGLVRKGFAVGKEAGLYGSVKLTENEIKKFVVAYRLAEESKQLGFNLGLKQATATKELVLPKVEVIEKMIKSNIQATPIKTKTSTLIIPKVDIQQKAKELTVTNVKSNVMLETKTQNIVLTRLLPKTDIKTLTSSLTLNRVTTQNITNIKSITTTKTTTTPVTTVTQIPKITTTINPPNIKVPSIFKPPTLLYTPKLSIKPETSLKKEMQNLANIKFGKIYKPSLYALSFNLKMPKMNIIQREFFRPIKL